MKYGKLPDDPFFEEMNPFIKMWLYESWINEIENEYEKMRQLGILIGSFYNPEAARKIAKQENPDYSTTEEEFEQSLQYVHDHMRQTEELTPQRKKKRKVILDG